MKIKEENNIMYDDIKETVTKILRMDNIKYKKEKKDLEKLARRLRCRGIDVTPLLIQGATAKLLLNETLSLKAGLLIMGTQGYGIAATTLLGSTSREVLKNVTCPILLIPYEK